MTGEDIINRSTTDGVKSEEIPAIRVDGLKKTFGNGEHTVTAVDDISFEIEKGAVVGLLGPNGAGKTTTIKSMLGLVLPDRGTIEISNINVHEQPKQAYKKVGAILEGARNVYWRLTVQENLSFFAGLGGDDPRSVRTHHEALLEQFGLTDWAETPVNELSRGMKQKVSLASTLSRDVDVVFMDEPTLGLDIETSLELRSELRRLVDREDMTIVLCSHDMDVIETVCDSVLVLNEGSIIAYDEVDALLELFRTRKYRMIVDRLGTNDVRRRLEQSFDANCTDNSGRLVVTITVTDSNELYSIIDILREADLELLDIESLKPNLEEVFLHLTGDGLETIDEDGAPIDTDTVNEPSKNSTTINTVSRHNGRNHQ